MGGTPLNVRFVSLDCWLMRAWSHRGGGHTDTRIDRALQIFLESIQQE